MEAYIVTDSCACKEMIPAKNMRRYCLEQLCIYFQQSQEWVEQKNFFNYCDHFVTYKFVDYDLPDLIQQTLVSGNEYAGKHGLGIISIVKC